MKQAGSLVDFTDLGNLLACLIYTTSAKRASTTTIQLLAPSNPRRTIPNTAHATILRLSIRYIRLSSPPFCRCERCIEAAGEHVITRNLRATEGDHLAPTLGPARGPNWTMPWLFGRRCLTACPLDPLTPTKSTSHLQTTPTGIISSFTSICLQRHCFWPTPLLRVCGCLQVLKHLHHTTLPLSQTTNIYFGRYQFRIVVAEYAPGVTASSRLFEDYTQSIGFVSRTSSSSLKHGCELRQRMRNCAEGVYRLEGEGCNITDRTSAERRI
jgi:hypothetical protein